MALTFGSADGTLNGVTAVEIVPAPSGGVTRIVTSIRFVNKDTITHAIRVRKLVSGTPREFANEAALGVDGNFDPIDRVSAPVYLTATTQSITALMDEAIGTTNPPFVASWIDRT